MKMRQPCRQTARVIAYRLRRRNRHTAYILAKAAQREPFATRDVTPVAAIAMAPALRDCHGEKSRALSSAQFFTKPALIVRLRLPRHLLLQRDMIVPVIQKLKNIHQAPENISPARR